MNYSTNIIIFLRLYLFSKKQLCIERDYDWTNAHEAREKANEWTKEGEDRQAKIFVMRGETAGIYES